MSSLWSLGDRLILGLAEEGQAFQNMQRHSECVVNLPSGNIWQQVEAIAPTTGCQPVPEGKLAQGYRHEADKFKLGGFSFADSECIAPKRVANCPIQVEAQILNDFLPTQTHDKLGWVIVEAKALKVWVHEELVIPDSQHIDPEKWKPLLYIWRNYFTTSEVLGQNFRDETRAVRKSL